MRRASGVFPTLIHNTQASWFGAGLLICDPQRLDEFLDGKSRYRDLTVVFDGADKELSICREGIAVPLFADNAGKTIIVRHCDVPSYIKNHSRVISEGWVLRTNTGDLLLCSFDSLLFWDPWESDEDLERYTHFTVKPGWYKVAIFANTELKEQDDYNDEEQAEIIEFVLTPARGHPAFTAIGDDLKRNYSSSDSLSRTSPSSLQEPETLPPSVDKELLKPVLSRFTQNAFEAFVEELFNEDKQACERFESLKEAGEGVFCQPILDSYGESLHTAFVLQYLPLGLFNNPRLNELADDPALVPKLEKISNIYKDACGYWGMVSPCLLKAVKLQSLGFLLNLNGISRDLYETELFPQYQQLLEKIGLYTPKMLIGSYDSFIDLSAPVVHKVLKNFFISNSECLSIELSSEHQHVSSFTTENSFLSGVLKSNKCPYEPVFENPLKAREQILAEFESLLEKDVREAELEKFLVAHYQDIFGSKYDRIETQLWLRFPEMDIAGRERRLDIFMRNSLSNDWELFEIKKVIPLIGNYRNTPVIASEVAHAVLQLKNYSRNLSQYLVKEKLARDGIEYCEPTLHLVAGRIPQISHAQWRWLLSYHDKDVRIITYDDLLAEMHQRISEYTKLLGVLTDNQER